MRRLERLCFRTALVQRVATPRARSPVEKPTLVRLGIPGFNPKMKRAAERLETLRTPEGGRWWLSFSELHICIGIF